MTFMPNDLHHNYSHGHRLKHETSPTYRSWVSMKSRCDNPDAQHHAAYGGRGITYCESWSSFENFLADMGERPEGTTIDRIDPNGNYQPDNCRWATSKQQCRNKRSTIYIKCEGEYKSLAEVSEKFDIPTTTLYRRYHQGIRGSALFDRTNRNKGRPKK